MIEGLMAWMGVPNLRRSPRQGCKPQRQPDATTTNTDLEHNNYPSLLQQDVAIQPIFGSASDLPWDFSDMDFDGILRSCSMSPTTVEHALQKSETDAEAISHSALYTFPLMSCTDSMY